MGSDKDAAKVLQYTRHIHNSLPRCQVCGSRETLVYLDSTLNRIKLNDHHPPPKKKERKKKKHVVRLRTVNAAKFSGFPLWVQC